MKKIISLLLAMLMVVSVFAGCNNTPATTDPVVTDPVVTEPSAPAAEIADVTYFSISYNENNLMLYPAETEGMASVYYMYDVQKQGELDAAAFNDVTAALAASGLVALNGVSEYADGSAYASLYVELADGTVLSCDYSGVIAQEFVDGFNAMANCFQTLTAELEVYVPQVNVAEDVDATVAEEIKAILNNGVPGADGLSAQNVPVDTDAETFGWMMGLSSAEGLVNATNCAAMMMTTPYSLNVVTVADVASVEAVAADFESKIDWQRWVCVTPTDALIATKDNMVLCVIGEGELYTATAAAIEAAGWTTVNQIHNELG